MLRALDLITVVVPPALPATLSIGTGFAISRLRKAGIFCISPSRVNVAGQINVCCFDKTGTLTEDGLDILGVRAIERNVNRFGELLEDIHDLPSRRDKSNFLYALATCHSLKKVDGNIIGDPLDVKMFEFTKWTLEEGDIAGTAVVKSRAGGERPAALVQTVVRPPGSAHFRLEDALKGAGKVSSVHLWCSVGLISLAIACTFPRTWGDTNVRVRIRAASHERYRQAFEKLQYGSLRQGGSGSHGGNLR